MYSNVHKRINVFFHITVIWEPRNNEKTNIYIYIYRQTSNIIYTLVGSEIVDHSGVVGASPVGAAPTTSSFSTWLQWIEQR